MSESLKGINAQPLAEADRCGAHPARDKADTRVTSSNQPVLIAQQAYRSVVAPLEGQRSENQDNFLMVDGEGTAHYLKNQKSVQSRLDAWPDGHRRYAVLDGVGGHDHGRIAAERSVKGLLSMPAMSDLDALSSYMEALHFQLQDEFSGLGGNAGSTVTLLEIPQTGPALLFHTGDSRLYRIAQDQVDCLTVDHVPATQWLMTGEIDEQEWRRRVHESNSAAISQAFILGHVFEGAARTGIRQGLYELHDGNLPTSLHGQGDRRRLSLLDVQPQEMAQGVVYLLATDGLWHLREPQAFISRWPELLSGEGEPSLDEGLSRLMQELVDRTRSDSSLRGDNTTVLAFRLAKA